MSKNTSATKIGNSSRLNSEKKPRKARVQNNNNKSRVKKTPRSNHYTGDNYLTGQTTMAPVAINKSVHVKDHGDIPFPVKRSEYIGPVSPTGTVWSILHRLRVNPGSEITFPWLSGFAGKFERYRFKKLHFVYIARCPTTTAGSLIFSPDYDSADGPPLDEISQASNVDTVENSPWSNSRMVMNVTRMNKAYKSFSVMSDGRFSTTVQDQKTIDCAQFFVSSDADAAGKWGKLWVEYEVDLFNPQANTEPFTFSGSNRKLGITSLGTGATLRNPMTTTSVGPATATTLPINGDIVKDIAFMKFTPEQLLTMATLGYNATGDNGIVGQLIKEFMGTVDTRVKLTNLNYVSNPITNPGGLRAILPNGLYSDEFPSYNIVQNGPSLSYAQSESAVAFEGPGGVDDVVPLPKGTILHRDGPVLGASQAVSDMDFVHSLSGMAKGPLLGKALSQFQAFSTLYSI